MPVSVVAYYPQVNPGIVGSDCSTPERRFGVVGHGGGTEIQKLSMTCLAQAAQGMQWMTATYGFQLGGTLTATPPC
jgi:hypothetical protein